MTRKKAYSFEDLDDRAKEKARDWFRHVSANDDWWDQVCEDAVRMGELLGITIYNRGARTMDNTNIEVPDIQFELNYDGCVSFSGKYEPPEKPLAVLEEAPQDEELHRIASRLVALQVTCKLEHDDQLHAIMTHDYRNNMSVEIMHDESVFQSDDPVDDEEGAPLVKLMHNFADWIYNRLEAESEYIHSDEYVDETILANEYQFTREGEHFGL